jgi:hypothetical protein
VINRVALSSNSVVQLSPDIMRKSAFIHSRFKNVFAKILSWALKLSATDFSHEACLQCWTSPIHASKKNTACSIQMVFMYLFW